MFGSLFPLGLEIFKGNRVVCRTDGDLFTDWGLYIGSISSRFVLSLKDRWLLPLESTFWGATAPYRRTWRALTPASRFVKMNVC